MKRSRTEVVFPRSEGRFTHAASHPPPVLLNGMRVIFDEKIALYPVELENVAGPPLTVTSELRDDRR